MPVTLDKHDVAILNVLMKDARLSYRQIANETTLSVPTVKARVQRMVELGLITKFAPIFDVTKLAKSLVAIITLKVSGKNVDEVINKLITFEYVKDVFSITGEGNVMLRVMVDDANELQEFINGVTRQIEGASLVSSQIVTKVIKNDLGINVKQGMTLKATCEWCKGEITRNPRQLALKSRTLYFCCSGCYTSFMNLNFPNIKSSSLD
ncbi:MAG: winged helix-turn-helix transcriptional regulator [Nitrososphaerales archaeon]